LERLGISMNAPSDQAKSIFLNALEFASAERQAYVAAKCGADEGLRREVEDLLGHHAGLGGFLEPATSLDAATVAQSVVADPLGTRIGPYKLLEPIGEGGMGTVYLAQQ